MKKRGLARAAGFILLFAAAFCGRNAVSAENENGLIKQEAGYVYYENGVQVVSAWRDVPGAGRYYFKADGYAAVMSTEIDGATYVFDEDGILAVPDSKDGIVTIGKDDYRVDGQGRAMSGWYKKKYYFDEDGKMVKGWMDGKKYYFDKKTGEAYTGVRIVGNKEKLYVFKANGKFDAKKTKKLQKTQKYKKDITGLAKILGNPIKKKYFPSCMGPGNDGIWKYKYFKISTYKPPYGKELYLGADPL